MHLLLGWKINSWENNGIGMLPHTLARAFHIIAGFTSYLKASTVPLIYNCKQK